MPRYAWLLVVAAALVGSLFLVRHHEESIEGFIDQNPLAGLLLYFLLNVLDAVLAPGATLPLIPVAAHAWGRVGAAVVTTAGWTAGSLVAFLIARRWGVPIVRRLTSMQRLRRLQHYAPEDLFWSIVVVRLVLPMGVISYVIGLFSDIGWGRYVVATALGLTPSAFLLAYLGRLPHAYELIALGIALTAIVTYLIAVRRRPREGTKGRKD
jgi:uncharacterized membrane protein YdjX (TVP38/TMEM64 family)